jgi:subtilisin-like proprotein convertase family protein
MGLPQAVPAQREGASANPEISSQPVYYYNGAMKVDLVLALDELAVKQPEASSSTTRKLVVTQLTDGADIQSVEHRRQTAFIRYSKPMDEKAVGVECARMQASLPTGEAVPVLYRSDWSARTPSDKLMLTRKLAVKLKAGGPSLDNILAAHNARVVQKVSFSHDTYILEVNSTDTLAALNVANALYESGGVEFATPDLLRERSKRAFTPNDPLFSDQWHLKHTGQVTGTAGNDVNIEGAWNQDYTGDGINIGITDDGLETTHPDLSANVRTDIDFDYFNNDNDPTPTNSDDHGTPCAGIAAAVGGNNLGVTGAAPEATLIGIRAIVAATNDTIESGALNHNVNPTNASDRVDINSNSWGPFDDANRKETFGPLTKAAVENGIANGRGGLGTLYVWAAGNGRGSGDNVNYDGYASSRYTIAVGASGGDGVFSNYSEPGASMLVTAPSSYSGAGTTTTDLTGSAGGSGDYTNDFGGTSSACPLVAGIAALILDSNPNLTWRDVQHVLVQSAEKNDPTNSDWQMNGAGLEFNHNYGFGRVDATAAVDLAEMWNYVPGNATTLSVSSSNVIFIPRPGTATDNVSITAPTNFVTEHVEVIFNATHTFRGDINVSLTSPDGTVSRLAETHNDNGDDYNNWMFTTVANWGENPNGTWTLTFFDGFDQDTGSVTGWTLNVHGYLEGSGADEPDIRITENGNELTSQTVLSFGIVEKDDPQPQKIVTIHNDGTSDLTVNVVTPAELPNDIIAYEPIAPGGSLQFNQSLITANTGSFSGNLTITSNDPDEAAVVIPMTGQVTLGIDPGIRFY